MTMCLTFVQPKEEGAEFGNEDQDGTSVSHKADAKINGVPEQFSEAYHMLVSIMKLPRGVVRFANDTLCVNIEDHWFGVIKSDGTVNSYAAMKAKNFARFVEISYEKGEEMEGQYMVVNSDGTVYVAQTNSEVLSRQTDNTSYSGVIGDLTGSSVRGVYNLGPNQKPKGFEDYANRTLTGNPVAVKGQYPLNRRWISVSLKVSAEKDMYRTEHFLLDTGSPCSIIQESCLTFDEKKKKLSCTGLEYSDHSCERDNYNYLSGVQLYVEDHKVRFKVYPSTIAEFLAGIEFQIAQAESAKERTEESAYKIIMDSLKEQKANKISEYGRFTALNLLGTDFLDSFTLIDDRLSENLMVLKRVAPIVKRLL